MAPTNKELLAAIVSESRVTFGLTDVPLVPKPGPGQILVNLVEVVAAAQNPTDCQFQFVVLHRPCKSSDPI